MPLRVPSPYEKALADQQAKFAEVIDKLRALGAIPAGVVRGDGNNRYGGELPLYVQACALSLHGAGKAYAALPFDGAALTAEGSALAEALLCKGLIDQLAADANALCQNRAAELSRKVDLVTRATEATLGNPGLDEATRRQTASAAAQLRELCQKRSAAIKSSLAAGKARRAADADKNAEASRLKVENRYLAGEALKPADVAPPAPRSARRRTKR